MPKCIINTEAITRPNAGSYHKETVEAAGAVKLQADLDELRNAFENDRSRLERVREEQSGALSDWVVKRFVEQR